MRISDRDQTRSSNKEDAEKDMDSALGSQSSHTASPARVNEMSLSAPAESNECDAGQTDTAISQPSGTHASSEHSHHGHDFGAVSCHRDAGAISPLVSSFSALPTFSEGVEEPMEGEIAVAPRILEESQFEKPTVAPHDNHSSPLAQRPRPRAVTRTRTTRVDIVDAATSKTTPTGLVNLETPVNQSDKGDVDTVSEDVQWTCETAVEVKTQGIVNTVESTMTGWRDERWSPAPTEHDAVMGKKPPPVFAYERGSRVLVSYEKGVSVPTRVNDPILNQSGRYMRRIVRPTRCCSEVGKGGSSLMG